MMKIADIDRAKELIRMCRAGRLYDIDRWIAEGYSIICLAESLTVFKRSSPGTTQPPPTKLRSSHDVISASGCQPGI